MHLLFRPYTHFFDVHGRSRRAEGWLWLLCANILVAFGAAAVYAGFSTLSAEQQLLLCEVGFGTFIVLNFIPMATLQVRRFHDLGTTGWWTLLTFVPVLGYVIALVSWLLPGNRGDNRYGADPRWGREARPAAVDASQRDTTSGLAVPTRIKDASPLTAIIAAGVAVVVLAAGGAIFLSFNGRSDASRTNMPSAVAAAPSAPLPEHFTSAQLSTAFAAVYPAGATIRTQDEVTKYQPDRLIKVAGDLLAVVSLGETKTGEAFGADASHAQTGGLRIDYVRWVGPGFLGGGGLPPRYEAAGSGFGGAPTYKVKSKNGLVTVLVETSLYAQGCTDSTVIPLTVTAQGIVEGDKRERESCESDTESPNSAS